MRGFRFRFFLAASPLVSSAYGRRNEAPRRTREKTSGTQGSSRNDRVNKHFERFSYQLIKVKENPWRFLQSNCKVAYCLKPGLNNQTHEYVWLLHHLFHSTLYRLVSSVWSNIFFVIATSTGKVNVAPGKSNRSSHHFSGIAQFISVDLFCLNLVKHCLLVKPLHVVCNNHDVGRECLIGNLSGGEA